MASEQTGETRSERVTLAITPTEKRALELIAAVHDAEYDGPSTVLRDHSLRSAVTRAGEIERAFASLSSATA
jgi:hypothetical protein